MLVSLILLISVFVLIDFAIFCSPWMFNCALHLGSRTAHTHKDHDNFCRPRLSFIFESVAVVIAKKWDKLRTLKSIVPMMKGGKPNSGPNTKTLNTWRSASKSVAIRNIPLFFALKKKEVKISPDCETADHAASPVRTDTDTPSKLVANSLDSAIVPEKARSTAHKDGQCTADAAPPDGGRLASGFGVWLLSGFIRSDRMFFRRNAVIGWYEQSFALPYNFDFAVPKT